MESGYLNFFAVLGSALIGFAGVVYTFYANKKQSERVKHINDNIGEFAKVFAPAADTAEQFTLLNKSLYAEIQRLRGELEEERVRASARESQLLGELEVERIAKRELLQQVMQLQGQVNTFQIQISQLEAQVRKALGESEQSTHERGV